ncbi:NDxxF motif lipoprotein [Bacillus toyonensis]|uniref:NDxxF motif lipoprotein n=1 Tax=Bacillus toyonensis TaxID=155322 RepID=UPI002E1FAB3E|nr:NDxxF motif lipoprotein [Bacillus toyonensis]
MKKYTLYLLMLFTIVFMSACSHNTQSTEASDTQPINDVAIEVPENIFNSEKKNVNISEDEMKQNIKNYLDYSHAITKQLLLYYDKNVTESYQEKLPKLIDQAKKNDANFHDFISNNNIPDDYKEPSKEIYEYTSSSTALLLELKQEIDKLAQNGNLLGVDFSFSERFTKANGRQQKEIEKFLNKKNIKTTYFNQQ